MKQPTVVYYVKQLEKLVKQTVKHEVPDSPG